MNLKPEEICELIAAEGRHLSQLSEHAAARRIDIDDGRSRYTKSKLTERAERILELVKNLP